MRWCALGLLGTLALLPGSVRGGVTVNVTNCHAYGANSGWLDARGDEGTNGMVVGEYYCSGYIYAANVGWLSLGDGTPANGYAYANSSATDYGVNHDRMGNLTGYAYGANIGWVTFETNYGKPRVDLCTGNLSGYVFSGNVGWLSLSNVEAHVQTDIMDTGPDTDDDGIPDPWEMAKAGDLGTLTKGGDHDSDGALDVEEYIADTGPADDESCLRIIAVALANGTNTLTWTTEPTRFYSVVSADSLIDAEQWMDCGLGRMAPDAGGTMVRRVGAGLVTGDFFRVRAYVPLR